MPDFEPITTQDDFNARIKDRLERERKSVTSSVTAQFPNYEDYKAKADKYDADTSELNAKINDLTSQIADRDAKIKKYETDSVKSQIAAEFGIPTAMVSRLAGETEEDIRKDAESLSALFTAQTRGYPQMGHDDPQEDPKEAAFKRMINIA